MKKQYLFTFPLRRWFLAACLFGALAPVAQGQDQAREQDAKAMQQPGTNAVPGAPAERQQNGLPNITNSRSEQRAGPGSVNTRPAKIVSLEKGVFETYVNGVTGLNLKIFGQDLFSDVPSTFAPFDGAQVNGDYVIGTGDELQIRGWGMIDIDVSVTVDRSGAIYIPRVGSVKVAGVKYSDLQGYLKKAISKVFTNFELTASIAQTRAVQIYVVGHAVRPGTYTLNAMSTLLNALFTSGGPDNSGSMRNIQLKRAGRTVATFDLYDMLVNGDKSRDLSLRDGDVIYIPEVGSLVALTGNVKQPAIFELKGPTTLVDLIGWAGGLDSAADTKRFSVEKNVSNSFRTVAEVTPGTDPRGVLAAIPVAPTDIVRVFAPDAVGLPAQIVNEFVQVSGEVKQSGVFKIRKGETLRDLLIRLGGANDEGYVFATQVSRESVRREQQKKLIEVADRFERELDARASQRIGGTADKDNATIIAAEVAQQREVVKRMRTVKAIGRIVLEMPGSEATVKNLPDLPLQDGDAVYVPRRPGTIDVLGAVYQQNSLIYRPNRTVSDYVALAGGPTSTADKGETYLIRADGTSKSNHSAGWISSLGSTRVNPGDTIVVPEKIDRSTWTQTFKEWTTILYQFGLGAAGLKVLKN